MNDELIKVGDKTYKDAQVYMLPDAEEAKGNFKNPRQYPAILKYGDKIGYWDCGIRTPNIVQHLYITSGAARAGEWCYSVRGFIGKFGEFENSYPNECKLIIATTDKSLNLPRPSDDFIHKFCEDIRPIKNILVENVIEDYTVQPEVGKAYRQKRRVLKVAPDNTISIIKKEFPAKVHTSPELREFFGNKLYSREEVENLINLAWASCSATTYKEGDDIGADCKSWIKTHLK